jgi:anti-anti-sigma regulatory factor
MLGLFASIRNAGFAVHLHNLSRNVRTLLEVTRLNTLFHIHDLGA